MMAAGCYLIFLNLFQLWQYNRGIIHYNDMNRRYYQAVYLNPHPSAAEMSLLDTDEQLENEGGLKMVYTYVSDSTELLQPAADSITIVFRKNLQSLLPKPPKQAAWLVISLEVRAPPAAGGDYCGTTLMQQGKTEKRRMIRLENAIGKAGEWSPVKYYFSLPLAMNKDEVCVFMSNKTPSLEIRNFRLQLLSGG